MKEEYSADRPAHNAFGGYRSETQVYLGLNRTKQKHRVHKQPTPITQISSNDDLLLE